jgi:hypothetical protein
MKVHPLIAAMALLLAGVMALGATLIVAHRRARVRRPPPVLDESEPSSPPRLPSFFSSAVPRPAPAEAEPEAPRGALRIRVTGPHGLLLPGVEASAVRQGDPDENAVAFDEPSDEDGEAGTLTATDLDPGRYDLLVEAPHMRPARVRGVLTGAETIAISLDRAPLLLGAVGDPALGACAAVTVGIKGRGEGAPDAEAEDEEVTTNVNPEDCTFAFEELPAAGPLTIVATSGAHAERALVTLPLAGDPSFVCLRPPCAAAAASLAVYVADATGAQVESAALEWTLLGDETRGEVGDVTGAGFTYLHGRRPGETLRLRVSVDDRTAETTLLVQPGVTDVVLTLPAEPSKDAPTPRAARRIRLDAEEDARPPSRGSAREPALLLR